MSVSVSHVSSYEATVVWTLPDGKFDHVRLTLTGSGDPKIVTQTGTSYSFLSLEPGTQYIVKVETQSGDLFSEAVELNFTTSKQKFLVPLLVLRTCLKKKRLKLSSLD